MFLFIAFCDRYLPQIDVGLYVQTVGQLTINMTYIDVIIIRDILESDVLINKPLSWV